MSNYTNQIEDWLETVSTESMSHSDIERLCDISDEADAVIAELETRLNLLEEFCGNIYKHLPIRAKLDYDNYVSTFCMKK